ncbi:MAG: hypothetical protein B6D62_02045 [Candidatus Cloacimonas sp. 4484_275]|nr:MAG: hypothetical protein B6D62_02045 [Candidatus Cloacimonas sp. 4484_275]
MKKIYLSLIIFVVLVGCTAKGDLKIFNNTNHYLYFTVLGNDYILPGSSDSDPSETIEIEIGKRFLFWGDDEKEIDLQLEGETFMMQLSDSFGNPSGEYYTETTVYLKAGKTTKVYTNPTHACVKLINNSEFPISDFLYSVEDTEHSILDYELACGDSVYQRLIPTTEENQLMYSFQFRFAGDEDFQEIPGSYSLFLDEELIILAADYIDKK